MYHEKGAKSISKDAAFARWEKEHTTQIKMRLNKCNDADILAKLESVGNKQGYIKELIRQDIARTTSEDTTK